MTEIARARSRQEALELAQRLGERFRKRASSYDEGASFPKEDIDELRSAGLLGLMVPQSLEGVGASFEDYTRIARALARGNPSTALIFNMHASVTGGLAGISPELARQLGLPATFFRAREDALQRAVKGAMYGVAISEREAGSRLSAIQTTYSQEAEGYRIRGHKSVCSGAGWLDAYLVAARPEEEMDGDVRVSYFLVSGEDGITVKQTWNPLGMRATASNDLSLDVHVPTSALLGVEGVAVLLAYAMPQWLVASYAAVYVGLAEAALSEAIEYLSARVVRPAGEGGRRQGGLAHLASVRARLGRADARLEAARLALEEAARGIDSAPGDPGTNRDVYRAKLLAGDVAFDVLSTCTEACGLGALRRGAPLERLFRDARSGAIMPPSSDVCADVLGASALGLDPATDTDVPPW